jgi:putative ABC transport system permease protein
MVIVFNQGYPSRLYVKLDKNNLTEGIDFVKEKWSEFDPNHPLSYSFLDETFAAQYRSEEKRMTIFGYFTLVTIFIACMGLFGLSAFITQQRTKEIGIRKVMGAELPQIMYLLTKDFAILVVVALVLASAIAGFGMHSWLSEFAYHEQLSVGYFFLAGVSALLIAFLTISYHTIQVGRSNPVEALRYE